MGAMQLCHHHDRRVAKNRKLGFRDHVRSSKVQLTGKEVVSHSRVVVSSFDKRSLLSLILIIGNICLPVVLYSFGRRWRFWKPSCRRELWTSLTRGRRRVSLGQLGKSSSRSRGDAAGITLSLSTPLDPNVHHADLAKRRRLSWRSAYEAQAAKTAWERQRKNS